MKMRKQRWMKTIEAYAAHASTSYEKVDPARFVEILTGSAPTKSEKVRVYQGLTEVSAGAISGAHADELACDLGMTRTVLEARCQQLCECATGANAFPEELPEQPLRTPK